MRSRPWSKLAGVLLLLPLVTLSNANAGVVLQAEGVDDKVVENIRGYLQLNSETCETPRWKVQREFRAIDKQAGAALKVFGYYRPVISKSLNWDDKCWQAQVTVKPGPQVTVAAVKVVVVGDAARDSSLQKALQAFDDLENDRLNHARYESAKRGLLNAAVDNGYIDARITHSVLRVDPAELTAEIDVVLESGNRYVIGDMHYSEQPLDMAFLMRLAATKPGDPLQSKTLIKLDRNLQDSGYFSAVDVIPLREQAEDNRMPLDVQLTPKKKHAWRAGVGYATDIGPRISGSYENRFFNERGHRWNTSLQLSPAESEWQAGYEIPSDNPHRDNYQVGFSIKHEDVSSYVTDSASINGRHTVKKGAWTEIRTLELLFEDFDIADENNDAILLMPGIQWQYQHADNPMKVARGYRFTIGFKGAYEGLLSTESFLQMTSSAKFIHRFGVGGRVTARGDLGLSWMDELQNMPVSLRFFAGGDNSVRGYDYESLGPVDASGEVIGGNHRLTGSLEYEHPVSADDWWLAAFVDAGNAFDDLDAYELKIGYGVGVRWFSPIGRIRLDFAVPRDTGLEDWKLHFSLGVDL